MTEPEIEFLCHDEEVYRRAEHPKPASNELPEWYKDLPFETESPADGEGFTVRACMSFLDALSLGWIVPAPFDVHVETEAGGLGLKMESEETEDIDFDPMSAHTLGQIGRDHPEMPKPLIKFHTPWTIRTPPGVSILIIPPLNRTEERFTPFAGVVESDQYFLEANIPSKWEKLSYEGVIEAGTPLYQVIPFTRDGVATDGEIRTMDESEKERHDDLFELINSTNGEYRREYWEPKPQARVVEREEVDDE